MNNTRRRLVQLGCASAALFIATLAGAQQVLQTVTTTYTYNADGALTLVTEQVDDGTSPTETYLLWDNFTPQAGNASGGTITPANGNLLGYGPAPETPSLTARFAYDNQDRLINYSDDTDTITYAYHPTWLLAQSTQQQTGDSFHFYYDNSQNPQAANIEQSSTGELSSRLGPLRTLSDGTEQVLLSPHKDVSGLYDPELETFTPYSYDPYGADPSDSEDSDSSTDYDLDDNPFRYAGEYRDPTWQGYYLRARWYEPRFQTFTSRDSFPSLNRYGYADGNPIMRVDPSGRRSIYAGYEKTVGKALGSFLNHLEKGKVGGAFARVFLAPAIGPLSFIANPWSFFKSLKHNYGLNALALAGTIALWVGTDQYEFPMLSYQGAFSLRSLGEAVSDVATSAMFATTHDFHRFNKRTFFDGLEFSLGNVFYNRIVSARGYRPFNLSLDDVVGMWEADGGLENEALVFRVKTVLGPRIPVQSIGPLGDALDLGWYHEALIAVTRDRVLANEFFSDGVRLSSDDLTVGLNRSDILKSFVSTHWREDADFQFVGRIDKRIVNTEFTRNPLNLRVAFAEDPAQENVVMPDVPEPYQLLWRNCQSHVTAVVRNLMQVR